MNWVRKESVHYALLLVVLLATAAVAVTATLSYIDEVVPPQHLTVITLTLWTLTMGFMLIAAAFGVWAIHFAAEKESLRRLSSLVDAMDYIRDGVVALDRQGVATGLNPAAVTIFGESARHTLLTGFCPSLSKATFDTFLNSETPFEAETELAEKNGTRTLRLRSQPSQGFVMLLVSDVTDLVRNRERTRRAAYVQLLGHMAKGVANDFNDLLCGISGHAAILGRNNLKTLNIPASAAAIQDCANRGMRLARQLIQLSKPGFDESNATVQTARHIHAGIDLLIASLPEDWTVDRSIETSLPPVNIPAAQLENLVQSLGLVTADISPATRHLSVALTGPDGDAGALATAAVLIITASALPNANEKQIPQEMGNAGVIATVIHSLILQAGGEMKRFINADGAITFHVLLPIADAASLITEPPAMLTLGLEAYAANWHILIDRDVSGGEACADHFRRIGINTDVAQGIIHILSAIQKGAPLDAIALGSDILGDDPGSIINTISKLSPRAGIVVQPRHPHENIFAGITGVVCVAESITSTQLLQAMIEARSRVRIRRK